MIGPILYDFKRAFLRLSTLSLLILFTIAGIGVAYLSYGFIASQFHPVNIVAVAVSTNTTCLIEGIVYDLRGEPINDATVKLYGTNHTLIKELKTSNGRFMYQGVDICDANITDIKAVSSLGETEIEAKTFNIPSREGVVKISVFNVLRSTGYIMYGSPREEKEATVKMPVLFDAKLILLSKSSGEARLIVFALDPSSPDLKPSYTVEYGFMKQKTFFTATGYSMSINLSKANITFRTLGKLDDYFAMYSLKLDMSKELLVLKIGKENETATYMINYAFMTPVEARYAGIVSGQSGLLLFTRFFPIVFLYLAYVLMAKPRSIGALEFVLARPVTRWDIYLTRYLAGVMTAIISVGLLIIALNAGSIALTGVTIDLYSNLVLFLGITGSLVAFYTLCYAFATSLRTGIYLAIAIILYLLFSMFWGVISLLLAFIMGGGISSLIEYGYLTSYFNPLGATEIAYYLVQHHYGLIQPISTVNPAAAIASCLAWIIVWFIIGYKIFEKTNISS